MDRKAISAGTPQVCFREDVWRQLRRRYIDIKVKAFFRERNIDFQNVWEVEASQGIIEREYDVESRGGVPFSYFYEVILQGISRKEDDKIVGVGYTITFDRDEVELDSEESPLRCSRSGLCYSEVYLGKAPAFYYLYFDFQELVRKAKSLDKPARY